MAASKRFHTAYRVIPLGVKYLKNNTLPLNAPGTKLEGIAIKSIQVDLEHIVGYWSKGKNIAGGHWDYNNGLKKAGIIKSKIIQHGAAGSYEVDVKLLNRSKWVKKSRFSDNWTIVDICQALQEALTNVTEVKLRDSNSWQLIGKSISHNLKIIMLATIENDILIIDSFYPKI
jgi:hypothetical protein